MCLVRNALHRCTAGWHLKLVESKPEYHNTPHKPFCLSTPLHCTAAAWRHVHCTAGWHPKRFEFEPEWDNDAEASIADIEFREEDSPGEVAAKLRLLEIYNLRLDEVGVL